MPTAQTKPIWPHARTVKMTAHRNGQWCKKIAGKLHYFGPVADADGALERYLVNADALHRGEDVATSPSDKITVGDVFNEYLASRKSDIDAGRRSDRGDNDRALGPAMFRRYIRAGEIVVKVLGRDRTAETLRPADFVKVMARLRKDYGTGTRGGYVTTIRSVFTWAADVELIPHPLNFGGEFKGTSSTKTVRRKRREGRRKFIEADTLRALIDVANVNVRTMLRLGVSVGFYAIDCSDLLVSDIDMRAGIVKLERHKTEVDRVAMLWSSTIADLKEVIATRPEPADPAHADHVFITRRGRLWVQTQQAIYHDDGKLKSVTHNDYIGQEFRRLFAKAGIERPAGCSFGWLRHTFYSVARCGGMIDAVNAIMGHAAGGMTEHYLEDIARDDLRAVSAFMQNWLATEDPAVAGRIG